MWNRFLTRESGQATTISPDDLERLDVLAARCTLRRRFATVERAQHRDSGVHQEVPALGGSDQDRGGGLPFLELLLSPKQLLDVAGGIL